MWNQAFPDCLTSANSLPETGFVDKAVFKASSAMISEGFLLESLTTASEGILVAGSTAGSTAGLTAGLTAGSIAGGSIADGCSLVGGCLLFGFFSSGAGGKLFGLSQSSPGGLGSEAGRAIGAGRPGRAGDP